MVHYSVNAPSNKPNENLEKKKGVTPLFSVEKDYIYLYLHNTIIPLEPTKIGNFEFFW
jgi:hypothetical protein